MEDNAFILMDRNVEWTLSDDRRVLGVLPVPGQRNILEALFGGLPLLVRVAVLGPLGGLTELHLPLRSCQHS